MNPIHHLLSSILGEIFGKPAASSLNENPVYRPGLVMAPVVIHRLPTRYPPDRNPR